MTAADTRSASPQPLFKSWEWVYVLLTIGAFVFSQGLGRIVSWRIHHNTTSTFVVIPLVLLCPIAIMSFRRRRHIHDRVLLLVMLLWSLGFGYAAFVATAHGSIFAPMYTAGEFCLPAMICLWLMTREEAPQVAHARLAKSLLFFGAIAAAYGIIQYVFAPPWDVAWLQDITDDSFGTPERFGIRVFGTLNGPGVFALFLSSVIVLSLPYVRMRNVGTMIALLLVFVGLLLSLVRTAWLAVAIGIAIYVVLTPNRRQALLGLLTIAAVCIFGLLILMVAVPNAAIADKLTQRFATLSNAQDDASLKERRATGDSALEKSLENPVGAGLGILGKLGSTDDRLFSDVPSGPIDNGFISRLFEMGLPGFVAFVLAGCVSIIAVFRVYWLCMRKRDRACTVLAASCVATQVVIFGMNLSGDDQVGIVGLIFFATLALTLRAEHPLISNELIPLSLKERTIVPRRRSIRSYRSN